MASVKPEQAEQFSEEDEDPGRVFAIFDAGQKGHTAPPDGATRDSLASRKLRKARHRIAAALRRVADAVEPPQAVRSAKRRA